MFSRKEKKNAHKRWKKNFFTFFLSLTFFFFVLSFNEAIIGKNNDDNKEREGRKLKVQAGMGTGSGTDDDLAFIYCVMIWDSLSCFVRRVDSTIRLSIVLKKIRGWGEKMKPFYRMPSLWRAFFKGSNRNLTKLNYNLKTCHEHDAKIFLMLPLGSFKRLFSSNPPRKNIINKPK